MRTILPLLGALMLGLAPLRAQQADSARLVVDRYLQRLNPDARGADTMLFIESRIISAGSPDTIVMRRWFGAGNRCRTELWRQGQLGMGFTSDGTDHWQFSPKYREWRLLDKEGALGLEGPYDFRGPLYKYDVNGLELTYAGTVQFQGESCHRVLVQAHGMYDRYYFFQQSTGLYFLLTEMETTLEEKKGGTPPPHVHWRGVQEYTPVGQSLLPLRESYQDDEGITLILHSYSLLPLDRKLFSNTDKP